VADTSAQAGAPTDPVDLPPPPPAAPAAGSPASDAALDRYRSAMRRSRTVYYAVLAVVVAALGTWVGVAWSRGEISHASLRTFAHAPAPLAVQAPSATQQQAWRATDRAALGYPQWRGTVVTYSRHTVGGRDARTGARTWSYTRTDRDVCTAVQVPIVGARRGTTIAIYANHGNCDEVSAFDSGTGQRRWTRTLDMDGMPVNGVPSLQATPSTLVVATHAVVYAIDPDTGYNRWTYQRFGCRIGRVVLGTMGALISQTCSDLVRCKDVKFCGAGPQLLLRDGSAGRDDDAKPNADKIKWNLLGDTDVPVSADDVLSAANAAGTSLHVLDPAHGQQTHTVPLTPATPGLGPVTAIDTDSAELIWISGATYALRPDAAAPQWRTVTLSPPTIAATSDQTTPNLATARITVATKGGVGILNGNDGTLTRRFPVGPPAPGSLAYSLGTGFLVAGPAGVAAYR
jgi:outer membrane protein assembly factor BamB